MSKRIELTTPVRAPRGEISAITLREPKYGDYMDLGLPVQWVSINTEGGGFEQETAPLIRSWVERLCDCDCNLLMQLTLVDTMALRDAVIDFFREARPLKKISTGLPAPSSSDGDGTFVPSTI